MALINNFQVGTVASDTLLLGTTLAAFPEDNQTENFTVGDIADFIGSGGATAAMKLSGDGLLDGTPKNILDYADNDSQITISNDGTLVTAGGLTVEGLTVGAGGGSDNTNTSIGKNAFAANTTGGRNVAIGYLALSVPTAAEANTAIGMLALGNCTGNSNVGVGISAGYMSGIMTSIGDAQRSVFIGEGTSSFALDQVNEIVIGGGATGHGSNTATIGDANIDALYMDKPGAGFVLKSPNGSNFMMTITDAGALSIVALS